VPVTPKKTSDDRPTRPATAAERKRAQRRRARAWDGTNISSLPASSLLEELAREFSKGSVTMVRAICDELVRRTHAKQSRHRQVVIEGDDHQNAAEPNNV